jgi:hypothetical protein
VTLLMLLPVGVLGCWLQTLLLRKRLQTLLVWPWCSRWAHLLWVQR